MHFWKVNGAGNDFIILNALAEELSEEALPALARRLCHRRLSLGADGLMVVTKPTVQADFRMLFYNSDGSLGEMCGNGARCICRFGYEAGLSGEKQTVETTAGIVTGERLSRREYRIRLNDPTRLELSYPVEVDGVQYDCAYVELGHPGLPHAVLPYADLRNADENELRELGRKLRHHPAFPKGANVNFYELTGEDTLYERTFERGVEDFTMACGTGTGSVVTVLTRKGLVSGQGVRAEMAGGVLTVDLERAGSRIDGLYLTGPTNFVAEGEITDEEI
ncbi:MAG: diaminopimelate epimerase [Oscillospiraceae bacterium]